MALLHKTALPFLLLFCGLVLWASKPDMNSHDTIAGDGFRYVDYAVSLHEYGVFGLRGRDVSTPPEAGNANAPLYPWLIHVAMIIDELFSKTMICMDVHENIGKCSKNFNALYMVQISLSLLSLFIIYLLVLSLSKDRIVSIIAVLLSLLSGVFQEYSFLFMTEILILPLFTALLLASLKLYEKQTVLWAVAIGVCLAVLTLTRPSYLYLFYAFSLFFIGIFLFKRKRQYFIQLLFVISTFVFCISPWALRNQSHFGSYTLTSGGYAEHILMERVNYNQMSWPEVGVAMAYWLPDFGDSLAKQIFPERLHKKLGWSEGTYYDDNHREKISSLSDQLGGKEKVLGHLIKEEVLSIKHVAVSIPLALRGSFVAKYWGLIGFMCSLVLIFQTVRRRDYRYIILALPLLFMVAFHAGLSVSIPRYNLPLIVLYAFSMAWYLHAYGVKIVSKIVR